MLVWRRVGGLKIFIYTLAKFNSNFDNTPNQGVQGYTAHNITLTRQQKNIGNIIISLQSSEDAMTIA